jgi:hypothetical protein
LHDHGRFFPATNPKTGALPVKLPEARVAELIAAGHAHRSPKRPFFVCSRLRYTHG